VWQEPGRRILEEGDSAFILERKDGGFFSFIQLKRGRGILKHFALLAVQKRKSTNLFPIGEEKKEGVFTLRTIYALRPQARMREGGRIVSTN